MRARARLPVNGLATLLCWGGLAAQAAPPPPSAPAGLSPQPSVTTARPPAEEISFAAYLAEVAASNLDYAAARYGVPLAEAQLTAARVFPNPALNFGSSGRDITDHGDQKEPSNNAVGVSQEIELGGKRGKRVAVARANLAQAAATLDDFFRTLRANAATAFIDALTNRRIAEEKKRSAEALDQLVAANRKRLDEGDIGEIDFIQSRVDALQFHSEYLAALSDAQVAATGLEQLLGRRGQTGELSPAGNLERPLRTFEQESLAEQAARQRPDVIAAGHALASARAGLALAATLRVPDLNVAFTVQDNHRSTNVIAPAPAFTSLGLAFTVNLPVFNRYRGELETARQTVAQSETNLHAVEVRARVEVRQALARYQLAQERAAQFQGGALDDAAAVFRGRLFSYEHGAASLLDVLNAQRVENDVRLAYLDALAERAKALVAVEQAAGIWDIDF